MTASLKGHENVTAALLTVAGVGVTLAGATVSVPYWQGVLANLGTGTIGLGVGVAIVNAYFDYKSRRRAVLPLAQLVAPSISEHHNEFLRDAFGTFGRDGFDNLFKRYLKHGGRPDALAPQERQQLYDMVKAKKADLDKRLTDLASDLRELATLLGWNFDPEVLGASFRCRYSIRQFLTTACDDSPDAVSAVCEHYLDVTLYAHLVFDGLVTTIGDKRIQPYRR